MAEKNKINYADFRTRFLAGIVDFVIIIILSLVVVRGFNLAGMKIIIRNQHNEIVEISSIVEQIKEKNTEEENVVKGEIKESEEVELNFDSKTQKHLNAIFLFVSAIYSVYFVSSKRQGTPGKQLFKIMIIDRKHGRMSIMNAFVRYVAKRITNILFFVGYLSIFFTKEKISLHDFLSNTRVVHIKLKEKND